MRVLNRIEHTNVPLKNARENQPNLVINRVVRQLLEAILFEKVCQYQHLDGYFYFMLGHTQYKTKGKITGFSRIRLDASQMHAYKNSKWQAIQLAELVANLPAKQHVKNKLITELNQTIALCNWNNQFLSQLSSRRDLSYAELESAIDEGHPYHPCFKARTGFSDSDHKNYGPEAANHFQLHWIALHSSLLKFCFQSTSEKTFWQQELGETYVSQLNDKLAELTTEPTLFSFLPIHPWQWVNLQQTLAAAIDNQQLYYLGAAGDFYQASISVRTLINVSRPNKANIKLPLNMVNTSSVRSIENHSICTAPVLSNWLNQLYESDTFLQKNMVFLSEYAGISIASENINSQPWLTKLADQLGVIFRLSVNNYSNPKQTIPFVALTVIEQDNKPFIDSWIQTHGCKKWLQRLLNISMIPVWHLLVKHGIALEAHAQNMLIEHQQGWPKKVILRDFHESLEYVHSYLEKPQLAPEFNKLNPCYQKSKPNQYYWMSDVEALRELFVDTLLVFNLSDLAVLLESYYQFSEQDFWQVVYQAFKDYENAALTSPARLQQINIFEPSIQTESLLNKKLNGSASREFHHDIQNPLARASSQTNHKKRSLIAAITQDKPEKV